MVGAVCDLGWEYVFFNTRYTAGLKGGDRWPYSLASGLHILEALEQSAFEQLVNVWCLQVAPQPLSLGMCAML